MMRTLLIVGVVLILLLLGAGAGAWFYLYGQPTVAAAELVPADTVVFATIPNAMAIATDYQTSHLKQLIDNPNCKPAIDSTLKLIGQKNVDLINAFLPNLSGQSFFAVTHFDYDKPAQVGLIAGMRPKSGLGNFDAFIEKLKATYPDLIKQGTTGKGNVAGVDYQWIQGPGAPDKICVAQTGGWIVTAWSEATLQDCLERLQKKSATPSLAQNADYVKSLDRVGKDATTLAYLNYHSLITLIQKQMAATNPTMGDYFAKKLGPIGGAMMATRFENGEIMDRFSFLFPKQAQLDSGMSANPCAFETLQFTGPNTEFYWATGIDWKQYWKNLQEQAGQTPPLNPMGNAMVTGLQGWAQGAGLDVQHNIIDALGSELSVQSEWPDDATFPETGIFIKLDKPDDFKPVINAIIETVRAANATTGVIKELTVNDHHFSTLNFISSSPFTPTITEDGPYLGVFLTQNQAARSFTRLPNVDLPHNPDFIRQIGDKRKGASQLIFLDSPHLLDHGYRTAMPFISMAGMFNKDLAAFLKDKNLPPDLTWMAPMGTWSCVISSDDSGFQGYSTSGIGNQGFFFASALGAGAGAAQTMGLIPKPTGAPGMGMPPPTPMGNPPPPGTFLPPDATNAAPENAAPATAPVSAPSDATTPPAPTAPETPATPSPDMNSAPAPAPSAPSTNATPDATTPPADPAKTQ